MTDTSAPANDPTQCHLDKLAARVPLAGRQALDIGCGQGAFVAALQRAGAQAIGIEIDEAPLQKGRAAGLPAKSLRLGRAEALPFPDANFDLVCFIFSFHHVPLDLQDQALAEAYRVLRPSGHLHIVDPRPYGPMTEVLEPIDDEREVRMRSQARLSCAMEGFRSVAQGEYEIARLFPDAEHLIEAMIAVDPARAARAADPAIRAAVTARFARKAEPSGEGFRLVQPCVAFTFAPA